MKKKTKVHCITAGCLLIGVVMTGCSTNIKNSNIDLGIQKVMETNYSSAIEYFKLATEDKEDGMQLYRGYGLAYMGLSEYEQAVSAFETALSYSTGKLTDYEYDINYYLATAYSKVGRYEDAIDVYTAILDLRPKDISSYYLRGTVELQNGEFDAAKEDFDHAISLNKTDYSIYIDIYTSLSQNGYEEEGLAYLKSVMDTENNSMTAYDKGQICYYLGDYANACVYLEEAYSKNNDEETMLLLGRAYEADGNLNYASTLFNKYLQSNPQSASVYNELGLCRLKQEDYSGALDAFQTALTIDDNDMLQTLKYNEIVAYEYMGEYRRATVLLETYLLSYPDDEAANREYVFLQTR